jgi:hypothetical protein
LGEFDKALDNYQKLWKAAHQKLEKKKLRLSTI